MNINSNRKGSDLVLYMINNHIPYEATFNVANVEGPPGGEDLLEKAVEKYYAAIVSHNQLLKEEVEKARQEFYKDNPSPVYYFIDTQFKELFPVESQTILLGKKKAPEQEYKKARALLKTFEHECEVERRRDSEYRLRVRAFVKERLEGKFKEVKLADFLPPGFSEVPTVEVFVDDPPCQYQVHHFV